MTTEATTLETTVITLAPGMLLLDPNKGHPQMWTVKKVFKTVTHIVAHYGSCYAEATLTGTNLPKDWKVIPNHTLAAFLHDLPKELETHMKDPDCPGNVHFPMRRQLAEYLAKKIRGYP